MAGDDATRLAAAKAATALQQCIADKMATLQDAEKKVIEARTLVCTIILLLKEEQAFAATLEAEDVAAAL
jgi:hypothetical protein